MSFAFHFLRPLWLLALLLAVWVWRRAWRRHDARAAWSQVIAPHLLPHLLTGAGDRRHLQPIHLLAGLWVFSILALAGPSWTREPSPFAEGEAGMMVLLKVTPSMMATDVQPTRLDRAKHKLRDLLELRDGAATGLIAYSGSAHLVMPLTRDSEVINIMAEGLSPETMPVTGDDLPAALAEARAVLVRTGRSGSILVMADTVGGGELPESRHVQFLAIHAPGTRVDPGLQAAARTLDAQVTSLAVDNADVAKANRQAESELKNVLAAQNGERWKDAGYWLVPVIVLCAAVWGRRGWVVE